MARLQLLAAARTEYDRAFDWYLAQSKRAAGRFIGELESAIEAIREHPDQQLRLDDTYNFRLLNRFPYYIAFRRTPESTVIVAIQHTSQDQDAWQGR